MVVVENTYCYRLEILSRTTSFLRNLKWARKFTSYKEMFIHWICLNVYILSIHILGIALQNDKYLHLTKDSDGDFLIQDLVTWTMNFLPIKSVISVNRKLKDNYIKKNKNKKQISKMYWSCTNLKEDIFLFSSSGEFFFMLHTFQSDNWWKYLSFYFYLVAHLSWQCLWS